MRKTLSFLGLGILFSVLLFSCSTQKNANPVADNAQTSLDYDGIYQGTLPCADCEGIKTTIYLMKDGSYKLVQDYLNEGEKPFETTGKFAWNKAGNTIQLDNGVQKSQFMVGENTLTQLNQDGSKITGALARFYILTKGNYALLNKKWRLVQLMGKSVNASETMKKDAFIQFDNQNNRYTASAGCNTISGGFTVDGFNHLTFEQGMSTMMACPDMKLEDQLKEVLSTADTFQIHGDEMTLIKGRMAPLAVFKVAMN